jgi:hypothetical protein
MWMAGAIPAAIRQVLALLKGKILWERMSELGVE